MDSLTGFGNVRLSITARELLNETSFEYGDAIRVRFLDKDMVLPLVSAFSLLDAGETGLDAEDVDPTKPSDPVLLFINIGDFTSTYGIAERTTNEDGSWDWSLCDGVQLPIDVTLSLEKKEAFPEYAGTPLMIMLNRSDYPHLTDAEFANFRMVTTSGFGNCFYRGGSPIDNKYNRSAYLDVFLDEEGIELIINLSDSPYDLKVYLEYADTVYSTKTILFNVMGIDYSDVTYKENLRRAFKFIADNQGVYYVHCQMGKDRTGVFCAILEALMGASAQEIIDDYMLTFVYFYNLELGTKYDNLADTNICDVMEDMFNLDCKFRDIPTERLSMEAEKYLKSIGLTDSDLANLKENISRVR